jgi:hypothetical protein
MRLYVDVDGDDPYLVTDDGELAYFEEIWEEGRDTEQLYQTAGRKAGIKEGRRIRYTEPGGYDLD